MLNCYGCIAILETIYLWTEKWLILNKIICIWEKYKKIFVCKKKKKKRKPKILIFLFAVAAGFNLFLFQNNFPKNYLLEFSLCLILQYEAR